MHCHTTNLRFTPRKDISVNGQRIYFSKGQAPLYCTFNSKGTLYNALKQLQPYVRIDENIENYKPTIN